MKTMAGRKSSVDLIQGPIFKSMVVFAIPLLFSNVFQQLYNTMDTVIIGYTLGDEALAAMGAAGAVYDLLMGFCFGIGNGLTIVTARSYGSGDSEQLKKSVAAAIVIGAGTMAAVTLLARFILYPFLQLLHTPPEILDQSYAYVSTITLFIAVMFAYNLCSGCLRAIGNSVMPLVFLILSSMINIVLDFLFITGLGMGIQGAAVATVIAQGVSVICCLIYIGWKIKILIPQRKHFNWNKELYKEMLTQGFSMGLMNCIVSASTAILQFGINNLGYLVIAGHTAARKLCQFLNMPFVAMSHAMSTFVSQNYGAGQIKRIRKAMKCVYIYGAVLAVGVTVLMLFFAPGAVRLLSGSEESVVIENGALYLRVVAPALAILAMINPTRFGLQAIGQKVLPVLSSVIELFGKILFVIFLIPKFQYMAVVFCEPVIWCFMVAELLISFWRNPVIREGK